MDDNFILTLSSLQTQLAVAEITSCNDFTSRFGLALSPTKAQELVETRAEVLTRHGRIEFGGGVIEKLIIAFCDSPFLSQSNYSETLNELIETFYYFKNESLDSISDDELISVMKTYFDNNCRGSVELLQSRELETLAHNIRYGITDYTKTDEPGDSYSEEEQYDE